MLAYLEFQFAAMKNEKTSKSAIIQSISRARSIITCLSNGIETLSEIADYCKLSRSTVHRLLKALEQNQLTLQDPLSRRYYLGPLITGLASKPQITHRHLIIYAMGEMKRLSDLTEETITLSLMVGVHIISLYSIPSNSDLRVITEGTSKIGPTCVGATDKILFSQLEDEDRIKAVKHIRLKKFTDNTITDKTELLKQLKQIRLQGYSISSEERIKGAMSIAVPIKNYLFPTALALLGPAGRINLNINSFIVELVKSADTISRNIRKDIWLT